MRPLAGVLLQSDYMLRSSVNVDMERRHTRGDTQRGQRPHEEAAVYKPKREASRETSSAHTSILDIGLQNGEKSNFGCLRPHVCGVVLWGLQQTNIPAVRLRVPRETEVTGDKLTQTARLITGTGPHASRRLRSPTVWRPPSGDPGTPAAEVQPTPEDREPTSKGRRRRASQF